MVATAFPTFTSPEAFTSTLLGGSLTEPELALMGAVFEAGGLGELSGVLTVLQKPQGIGGDIPRERFAAAVYRVVSRDSARIQQLLMQARTSPLLPHSSMRFNPDPQAALAAVFGDGLRKNSEVRVGDVVGSQNSGGLRAQGMGSAASASAVKVNAIQQMEEARRLIADGKVQEGTDKLFALIRALSDNGVRNGDYYSRMGDILVEAGLAIRRRNSDPSRLSTIFQTAAHCFIQAFYYASDTNEGFNKESALLAKECVVIWFGGDQAQAINYLGVLIMNVAKSRDRKAPQVYRVLNRMKGYMLSMPPDADYMLSVHPDYRNSEPSRRYRLAIELLAVEMTDRLTQWLAENEMNTERLGENLEKFRGVVVPGFVEGVEKLLGPVLAGAFLSGVMPAETLARSREAAGVVPATPVNDTEAERARALQLIESGDLVGGITILFNLAWRAKSVGKYETAAELALDQAFALRNKGPRTIVKIKAPDYPHPWETEHVFDVPGRFYEASRHYVDAASAQTDLDTKVRLYMMSEEAFRLSGMRWGWHSSGILSLVRGRTKAVIEEMATLMQQDNITGGRRGESLPPSIRRLSFPGFTEEVKRLLGPRLSETFFRDLMPQGAVPAPAPTAQVSKPATAGTVAPSTTPVTIPIQADDQVRKFVKGAVRAQKIKDHDLASLAGLLGPRVGHVVAVDDLRAEIRAGKGPLFDAFATLAGYTAVNKRNLHSAIGHLIK